MELKGTGWRDAGDLGMVRPHAGTFLVVPPQESLRCVSFAPLTPTGHSSRWLREGGKLLRVSMNNPVSVSSGRKERHREAPGWDSGRGEVPSEAGEGSWLWDAEFQ